MLQSGRTQAGAALCEPPKISEPTVRAAAVISLEPPTPAVPAATEKNQHNNEDYEKCRRVHAALLARLPTDAAPGSFIDRNSVYL
jgi:hypothetical protein